MVHIKDEEFADFARTCRWMVASMHHCSIMASKRKDKKITITFDFAKQIVSHMEEVVTFAKTIPLPE